MADADGEISKTRHSPTTSINILSKKTHLIPIKERLKNFKGDDVKFL